jgi:O-antigen/teichoic acid export membrane protein
MTTLSEPIPAPIADAEREATLRVGRNFSFRMAAQVASAVINVTGMVLLGNAMSADGYGQYAFFYALIALIASMADGGVGIIVTRESARRLAESPRLLGDGLLIKAAVSTGVLAIVSLGAFAFLDRGPALLVMLVTATALIDFSQDPAVWTLRAHERLHLEAVLLIVSQAVWLVTLAACVAAGAGLPALLGAATFAFATRLTVGAIVIVRRFHRPVFRFDAARLWRLLAQALPFGLAMLGVVLYARIGVLMLKALSTAADVGWFHVSYMLSQPFGFIASGLSVAAFPLLARRAVHQPQPLRHALRHTYRAQALLSPALTVGLFLLAEPIVALLFRGDAMRPAAQGLRIMSLSMTLLFLNLTSRYALTAMDRQREYLKAIVAGLLAGVGTGLLLIPAHGFRGACVATVAGELATAWVCHRALRQQLSMRRLLADLWRPALAALGMGAVLFLARDAHVVLLAALGAATYLALLRALRALTDGDVRWLGRVLSSLGPSGGTPAGSTLGLHEKEVGRGRL